MYQDQPIGGVYNIKLKKQRKDNFGVYYYKVENEVDFNRLVKAAGNSYSWLHEFPEGIPWIKTKKSMDGYSINRDHYVDCSVLFYNWSYNDKSGVRAVVDAV